MGARNAASSWVRFGALATWLGWVACLAFSFPLSRTFTEEYLVAGRIEFLLACCVCLVAGVMAEKRMHRPVFGPACALLAPACATLGSAALCVAHGVAGFASPAVIAAGNVLAGIGCGLFYLGLSRVLSQEDSRHNPACVPAAGCVGALLFVACALLPTCVLYALTCLYPLLGGACLAFCLALEKVGATACPASIANVTPSAHDEAAGRTATVHTADERAFKAFRTTACVAVFWFALGVMWSVTVYTLAVTDFGGFALYVGLGAFALCGVVCARACRTKTDTTTVFWFIAPLVILAIAVAAVFHRFLQLVFLALLCSARFTMEVQLIGHFLSICRAKDYPGTLLFGYGFATLLAAEAVGTGLGAWLVLHQHQILSVALLAVMFATLAALVVSMTSVTANVNRRKLADAVALTLAKTSKPSTPTPQSMASDLAREFGLTARETEVAALLLEGRSAPNIAQILSIGLSTVNTHVKHVYEKTGFHNRTELIDAANARAPRQSTRN